MVERRPPLGDHDGFVLILMVAQTRRKYKYIDEFGWFGNNLKKEKIYTVTMILY